ncbi:unnamed protein product [Lathyrus sativus]|nr:unnamed protein product [Lathyrus sativus]
MSFSAKFSKGFSTSFQETALTSSSATLMSLLMANSTSFMLSSTLAKQLDLLSKTPDLQPKTPNSLPELQKPPKPPNIPCKLVFKPSSLNSDSPPIFPPPPTKLADLPLNLSFTSPRPQPPPEPPPELSNFHFHNFNIFHCYDFVYFV